MLKLPPPPCAVLLVVSALPFQKKRNTVETRRTGEKQLKQFERFRAVWCTVQNVGKPLGQAVNDFVNHPEFANDPETFSRLSAKDAEIFLEAKECERISKNLVESFDSVYRRLMCLDIELLWYQGFLHGWWQFTVQLDTVHNRRWGYVTSWCENWKQFFVSQWSWILPEGGKLATQLQ